MTPSLVFDKLHCFHIPISHSMLTKCCFLVVSISFIRHCNSSSIPCASIALKSGAVYQRGIWAFIVGLLLEGGTYSMHCSTTKSCDSTKLKRTLLHISPHFHPHPRQACNWRKCHGAASLPSITLEGQKSYFVL